MDKQPKTKLSPLTEETRPARVLVLSYPVFILSLSLALVVGILAGSFLSQHMAPAPAQNVVHQSQPQTQAQPQARQEQPQISRETQQHIAELEKKVLQDGKNRDDWVHLGHLYFDTNQPENAIAAYEHALALDRKDSNVLTDLGVMYRATAQYTKALACFEEAQAITPGHLVSLYNKGVVLYFDLHRRQNAQRQARHGSHPGCTAKQQIAPILCSSKIPLWFEPSPCREGHPHAPYPSVAESVGGWGDCGLTKMPVSVTHEE